MVPLDEVVVEGLIVSVVWEPIVVVPMTELVGDGTGQLGLTLNKNGLTESPDGSFISNGSRSSASTLSHISWRISSGVRGFV